MEEFCLTRKELADLHLAQCLIVVIKITMKIYCHLMLTNRCLMEQFKNFIKERLRSCANAYQYHPLNA